MQAKPVLRVVFFALIAAIASFTLQVPLAHAAIAGTGADANRVLSTDSTPDPSSSSESTAGAEAPQGALEHQGQQAASDEGEAAPADSSAIAAQVDSTELATQVSTDESLLTVPPALLPNDSIRLESYIENEAQVVVKKALYGVQQTDLPPAYARYWKLGEIERNVYRAVKSTLEDIASGKRSSTVIAVSFADILPQGLQEKKFSAEDLGVDAVVKLNAEGEYDFTPEGQAALDAQYDFNRAKVLSALMLDCPELLYWFDKTDGLYVWAERQYAGNYDSETGEMRFSVIANESSYEFWFAASTDYAPVVYDSASGRYVYNTSETNTTKTSAVSTAIERAAGVVAEAKGKTDIQKLAFYKDTICEYVDYDENIQAKLESGQAGYGDPWQLVSVFDNNPSTNVVCEGYSKAFKLLADLTEFSNKSIAAHIVSGQMEGARGPGAHMWNLVSIDSSNYLVDVTNCDTGSVGAPSKLFMRGCSNMGEDTITETIGEQERTVTAERYTFYLGGRPPAVIPYTYDVETVDMYDRSERLLATTDYNPSALPHTHVWDAPVYNWSADNKKVTATRTCEGDAAHEESETVDATAKVTTQPTYTTKGETTYTATFENSAFEAQTKTVADIDVLPSVELGAATAPEQAYTGAALEPAVEVVDANGKAVPASAYTVTYANNVNAGTATATVTAKVGSGYSGTATATFKITPISISKATVSGIANKAYTGKALAQAPVVKLSGKTLKAGTDYTLSYKNNVEVGTATVTVAGKGNYAGSKTASFTIKSWERLSGSTALQTMQKITQEYGKATTAIVTTNALAAGATAPGYKDALAAAALAGSLNAPMLTTSKGALSAETKSELARMGVKTVYIVGSTNEVSANAERQIKATGVAVKRITGASPSARAVATAKQVKGRSDTAIIATQNSFKDALAISPYAYATKSPILYAESNKKLSKATVDYIKSAGFKKAIIVGGPVALPTSVESQLADAGITAGNITRLAGSNQYKTAQVAAEWALGKLKNGTGGAGLYQYASIKFQPSVKLSANKLGVARADDDRIGWKDALAGAALCGKNKSVLLLADAKNSAQAQAFVKANKAAIQYGYIFGGTSAVPKTAMDSLVAASL